MELQLHKLRQFVRENMELRHMSMRQYAEFSGISQPTLSRLLDETGNKKYTPDIETIVKVAESANVEPAYLFNMILGRTSAQDSNMIIAGLLGELPQNTREFILNAIVGHNVSTRNNNDE